MSAGAAHRLPRPTRWIQCSAGNAPPRISAPSATSWKVVFHLAYPYGLLVNYLSSIMGGIVKKGARDKADLRRNPAGVGCGPFEFVEWVRGDHITVKANPRYTWGPSFFETAGKGPRGQRGTHRRC